MRSRALLTSLDARAFRVLQWLRRPLAQALLVFSAAPLAPNASGEPRPIAGATEERKLLGVGSSAWFGPAQAQTHGC